LRQANGSRKEMSPLTDNAHWRTRRTTSGPIPFGNEGLRSPEKITRQGYFQADGYNRCSNPAVMLGRRTLGWEFLFEVANIHFYAFIDH